MFMASHIRGETYGSAFTKGRDIYLEGGVFDFSYDMYMSVDYVVGEVQAKVRGRQQSYYSVRVVVDEDFNEVSEAQCGCEAFYNYDGLCKHCVAALCRYVNERKPREILDARAAGGGKLDREAAMSRTGTEPSLKGILQKYSKNAGAPFLLPESIYGKVEIEPCLHIASQELSVEFKVGTEQKYVIKSIPSFLCSIEENAQVRYGKKLEFCHNREAFTPEAWRLVEFMQREDSEKRQGEHGGGGRGYYYSNYLYRSFYGSERYIRLDGIGVDRFLAAIRGVPFSYVDDVAKKTGTFIYSGEEYSPEMRILGGAAGVLIDMESNRVLSGKESYYFYKEKEGVIRRGKKALGEIREFFNYLLNRRGAAAYIADGELPMFCHDLLPKLKEAFRLRVENFDESLYLPKKPDFELYLDRLGDGVVGGKLLAVYGGEKYNVLKEVEPAEARDVSEERRMRQVASAYFNATDEKGEVLLIERDDDRLFDLLTGGLARLGKYMDIYTSEAFRRMKVVSPPNVSVGVSLKSDLLELSVQSDDLSPAELADILTRYDRKKKYVRMKNGDFLDVGDDSLGLLAEVRQDLQLTEKSLKNGSIRVPKYRAMYLDSALKSNSSVKVDKNKEFKAMVRDMKTIEDSDFEVPASLDGVMREYQKTGFLWLKTLCANGFGGILADDMGLGKTLQVISLLLSERQDREAEGREGLRSLIVCPASLVYNWQKEAERFAPELPTVIVAGPAAERRRIIRGTRGGDILITSYDLLKRDIGEYGDMAFSVQVIDEAQYIKNPGTQAAKSVKQISAGFKVALTGTPIENRLSELWSIFDYLMPGFLYAYSRFREEIEAPIVNNDDSNRMERLQRMIRPFVLRRLKGEVLSDLPDKLEENVFTRLEGEQAKLYDAHAQRLRESLGQTSDEDFSRSKIQILAELTKLRQICCDPALIFEGYAGGSAKADMCIELIENAVNGGHKVLLFSQFTTMLGRLADRLKEAGIAYHLLTGAVGKEQRMEMVESFNTDDVPVFCISLKAGGTGLNLTAADIVIHYDPWWNVAVQNQATDRAHRIGQEHVVTVYKLVSEGTIEEKIIEIQERKRKLAEQVLEGEGMDQASFSREELLELLG